MMSILNRIPLGRLLQKTSRSASKSSTNSTTIYNLPLRNDTRRHLSGFSFAGPRKLEEIMKTELIEGKNKAEISDIWMTYHENQERVHGTIVSGEEGKLILERADKMKFFIQPIFRDEGFFNLLSQFQTPSHFLLAYLEDYKMDPNRAQPLITFSVFNDLADSHDLSLVRCDIINNGIEDDEGRKVMQNMLNSYHIEEEYSRVKAFNQDPAKFDVDDYISCMKQKWKDGCDDIVY